MAGDTPFHSGLLTTVMSGAHSPLAVYRPSAKAPRGRWGRFLNQMRLERGWSQTQAFEHLRESLGLGPKSRSAYVDLESGRRTPSPERAAILVRYFGKSPDDEPETAPLGDPATLAQALSDLVVELREARREREAMEVRLRVMEAAIDLVRSDVAALQGRSAPPGFVG